ncbi:MAG: outer membrane protein assembly factor BamD [Paludibacteraceae bacterium]|nr:outer membrane protein assembly factor BamD [Paludibacteraceae bacterium]
MSIKKIIVLFASSLLLGSCGEYQKLLKSSDPDLKYESALAFFNDGKYAKALTLFEDVSSYYKGTERAQEVIIYLARSYMGMQQYLSSAEYYEVYLRNYPKGRYSTEARFQVAHCYYLDSPDARLDQTETKKAIDYYLQFIELYPQSPYAEQSYQELAELYNKLALKELKSAQLYYNLGTYLGDNYLSCEIVARNALKDYPSNAYCEEFCWLILASKYQRMVYSVDEKKGDRAREADDEYYSFITEYPESKHIKEAERFHKEIAKILQ